MTKFQKQMIDDTLRELLSFVILIAIAGILTFIVRSIEITPDIGATMTMECGPCSCIPVPREPMEFGGDAL